MKENRPKIAIVGSGLGGSSCAYYLKKCFDGDIEVDVIEISSQIGGDSSIFECNGKTYDFDPINVHVGDTYLNELIEICELKNKLKSNQNKNEVSVYGKISFALHHGLRGFFNFFYSIYSFTNKLKRIYSLQSEKKVFYSIENFLRQVDPSLFTLSQHSLESSLRDDGFSESFIETNSNVACLESYNRSNSVNGFAGWLSLAQMCKNLGYLENGTNRIAAKLLELCHANVYLNSRLVSVCPTTYDFGCESNSKTVTFEQNGIKISKNYDYVIIAFNLLKNSDFKKFFPDFDMSDYKCCNSKTFKVYYVQGSLNNEKQRLEQNSYFSMTWDNELFKIVSKNELQSHVFERIFKQDFKIVKTIDLDAYEKYKSDPNRTYLPNIYINSDKNNTNPRVFYLNAFKSLTKSKEFSCISARNIAITIHKNENSPELL